MLVVGLNSSLVVRAKKKKKKKKKILFVSFSFLEMIAILFFFICDSFNNPEKN